MYYRDFLREMAHPLYKENKDLTDEFDTAIRQSRTTTCEVLMGKALKLTNAEQKEDKIGQLLIDFADVKHDEIHP